MGWQLSYCSSTSTLFTSTCNSTVFDSQLAERDQLFQLISENAADMIALVDSDGRRLYNSPAYQKVPGYSPEDLKNTSSFERIHPDDRLRVVKAAEKARQRMMVG